nr:hypothetical protein CFP56_54909 [Quercus suber]
MFVEIQAGRPAILATCARGVEAVHTTNVSRGLLISHDKSEAKLKTPNCILLIEDIATQDIRKTCSTTRAGIAGGMSLLLDVWPAIRLRDPRSKGSSLCY